MTTGLAIGCNCFGKCDNKKICDNSKYSYQHITVRVSVASEYNRMPVALQESGCNEQFQLTVSLDAFTSYEQEFV